MNVDGNYADAHGSIGDRIRDHQPARLQEPKWLESDATVVVPSPQIHAWRAANVALAISTPAAFSAAAV